MDDLIGKVVDGFVLPCVLGEGASGVVFLGKKDGALRAIKVLKQGSADSFFAEARRQQSIVHPNVVQVYDVIRDPPAIVMEFMEGGTLEERLKNDGGSIVGNPLNAVNIAKDVVSGLIAIHSAGFVHRDIKPANILFNSSGVAKIGDLGVVARVDGAETASSDAAIAGTLFYRAPEQRYGVGDARSDIYSVGRVLYKMLTGKLPSDTGTNHPMDAADVDGFLDMVVAQCLEVEPSARFSSAQDLFYALDRLVVLSPMPIRAPAEVQVSVDKSLNIRVSEILNSRGVTTNVGDPWIDPAKIKPKQEKSTSAFGGLIYLATLIIFGSTAIFRACNLRSSVSSPSPSAPSSGSRSYIEHTINNVVETGVPSAVQRSLKPDYEPIGPVEKLLDCSDLSSLLSGGFVARGREVLIYDFDGINTSPIGAGVVLSDKRYVLTCDNVRFREIGTLTLLAGDNHLSLSVVGYSSSANLCLLRASESDGVLDPFKNRGLVRVSEDYSGVVAKIPSEIGSASWRDASFGWSEGVLSERMFYGDLTGAFSGAPVYNKHGALCGLLSKDSGVRYEVEFDFIPAPKLIAFIDALRE